MNGAGEKGVEGQSSCEDNNLEPTMDRADP